MKNISALALIGLAFFLNRSRLWAADDTVLCANWASREAAITQMEMEHSHGSQKSLSEALQSLHLMEVSNGDQVNGNEIEYVNRDIARFQDKSRLVLEQDKKWAAELKEMNIQAIVISKNAYPKFVQGVVMEIKNDPAGEDIGGLKQELMANPLNLSGVISGPKIQLAECRDTYIIYQSNIADADLAALDNVAKVWK